MTRPRRRTALLLAVLALALTLTALHTTLRSH